MLLHVQAQSCLGTNKGHAKVDTAVLRKFLHNRAVERVQRWGAETPMPLYLSIFECYLWLFSGTANESVLKKLSFEDLGAVTPTHLQRAFRGKT